MDDRELTAFCGLFCGDCIRFECKASDLATLLLDELRKSRFREYAEVKRSQAKELEHYESMVTALKGIEGIKCETPCRLGGDGCEGSCAIIPCVKGRGLEGCWECPEFEKCEKLDFLKPFHGDGPRNNLRRIQTHGLDGWAQYRDKCYPWV